MNEKAAFPRTGFAEERWQRADPVAVLRPAPGTDSSPEWLRFWNRFLARHQDWWERVGRSGPVYKLPVEVINGLGTGTSAMNEGRVRQRPAFIAEQDKEAELDFADTCLRCSDATTGFWDGCPVEHPFLMSASNSPSGRLSGDELRLMLRVPTALNTLLLEIAPYAVWDVHQTLGYAGLLCFEPQYLAQLNALKTRFDTLTTRPSFPLVREAARALDTSVTADGDQQQHHLGATSSAFESEVDGFLQKWQLLGLVTWDLPIPLPPLFDVPLDLASRVLGEQRVTCVFPTYFDIQSHVNVKEKIRDLQRRAANEAGIEVEHPVTNTSARKRPPRRKSPKRKVSIAATANRTSASAYESELRAWLVERSVILRYGKLSGITSRLIVLLAKQFRCSERRVKQMRERYRPFLVD